MADELALQRPKSVEELRAMVAAAAGMGHQVRVSGSNTMAAAGFDENKVQQPISLLRMNKVIEHAVTDMSVTVEAGISLEALQKALAWQNQWLPVDPPGELAGRSPLTRTLGGLVATNSLGPLRHGCGDFRQIILGMRLVNPAGELIAGGGKTVKNVAGYSLPRLMIGSSGTLGVIAELTLRTHARPADEQAVVAFVESAQRAEAILAAVAPAPLQPAYVQIIGGAGFEKNPLQLPTHKQIVVIGFLGRAEMCAAQVKSTRRLPVMEGVETIAQTAAQAARLRLWMTTTPAADGKDKVTFRSFCLASKAAAMVAELEQMAAAAKGESWIVAEAGAAVVRGAIYSGASEIKENVRLICLRHGAEVGFVRVGEEAIERPATSEIGRRVKVAMDEGLAFGVAP